MKIESRFTHEGLDCLVLLNTSMDIRCGYVRVPEDHVLHGKEYDDVSFQVHGGLTFSGRPQAEDADGWWFGFDCGHAGDRNALFPDGEERTLTYVEAECRSLAAQLKARGHHPPPRRGPTLRSSFRRLVRALRKRKAR